MAIVRDVSASIIGCQLTHIERHPIDYDVARRQHAAYVVALEAALRQQRSAPVSVIETLPTLDGMPDAVFVEDTVVIVDECVIITRPGAASRRGETASMKSLMVGHGLRPLDKIYEIAEPGSVDGGDVLILGKHVFVGMSSRSNDSGVAQMQSWLLPFGYSVQAVADLRGCLHLKSAITALSDDAILCNPDYLTLVPSAEHRAGAGQVSVPSFLRDYPLLRHVVCVDPSEPGAANAVRLPPSTSHDRRVLFPAEYPKTADRLRQAGFDVILVEAAELAKAEGAVTCCSVLFRSL